MPYRGGIIRGSGGRNSFVLIGGVGQGLNADLAACTEPWARDWVVSGECSSRVLGWLNHLAGLRCLISSVEAVGWAETFCDLAGDRVLLVL